MAVEVSSHKGHKVVRCQHLEALEHLQCVAHTLEVALQGVQDVACVKARTEVYATCVDARR